MTVQGREPQHLLVDCGKTFEEATSSEGDFGGDFSEVQGVAQKPVISRVGL